MISELHTVQKVHGLLLIGVCNAYQVAWMLIVIKIYGISAAITNTTLLYKQLYCCFQLLAAMLLPQ